MFIFFFQLINNNLKIRRTWRFLTFWIWKFIPFLCGESFFRRKLSFFFHCFVEIKLKDLWMLSWCFFWFCSYCSLRLFRIFNRFWTPILLHNSKQIFRQNLFLFLPKILKKFVPKDVGFFWHFKTLIEFIFNIFQIVLYRIHNQII